MLLLQKDTWTNIGNVDKTVRQELLGKIAVVFSATTPSTNTPVYDYIKGDKPHALGIPQLGQSIWLKATVDTAVYINNTLSTAVKSPRLKHIGDVTAFTAGQEQELEWNYQRYTAGALILGQSKVVIGQQDKILSEDDITSHAINLMLVDGTTNEINTRPLSRFNSVVGSWDDLGSPAFPKLARKIANELNKDVTVVLCALPSTGFTSGEWDNELALETLRLITDAIINKNVRFELIQWDQGEGDWWANAIYRGKLANWMDTVRQTMVSAGQENGMSVPIVMGRILPAYIGDTSNQARSDGLQVIDNILVSMENELNYCSSTDNTGLPVDPLSDGVHYTAIQQQFMADRYFDAWLIARNKQPLSALPTGEHLILSTTGLIDGTFSSGTKASVNFMSGGQLKAGLYSNFELLHKARNESGLKLKVVATVSGVVKELVFTQSTHPWFSFENMFTTHVISNTNDFWAGHNKAVPFNGITRTDRAEALFTINHDDTSLFGAIGLFGTWLADGDIPLGNPLEYASELQVYAIKE